MVSLSSPDLGASAVMWIAIFLGSLVFFVQQTYTLTVKFAAKESVTSVGTEFCRIPRVRALPTSR